jgi:DNA-binding Lrp family transcriptional regulator
MPISATILINVERGSSNQVAQAILGLDGVEKVFSVAGRFDLVVLVKAKGMEELSDISNN